MGKKWENFQKFSFSFKKEKVKKKRPLLFSPLSEYTLTRSLARSLTHYYAFLVYVLCFLPTRDERL